MPDTVTKRIYFVRHGETDANVDLLLQGPDEPLNERGLKQAEVIAERSKGITFEKIISSDHLRAKQTASAIAIAKDMEYETSPLFGETRPPSQFFQMPVSSPEVQKSSDLRFENRHTPEWHFTDEENVHDIINRAEQALKYLEDDSATEILVVTHGLFLRTLVMKVILCDKLDPDIWYATRGVFKTSNTGITVCERVNDQWRVLTWNDHAHFAE